MTEKEHKYFCYSIELFSEVLFHYTKIIRAPDSPRGNLILSLERLIAALRQQPFHPVTEYERRVRERAIDLLDIADQSVNGPDTTEGRAKLYTIVSELKAQR